MTTVDYHAMIPTFVIPPAAVTLDGFRTWTRSDTYPERGQITFIQGRLIVDMSPERYETHLKIKSEVNQVVGGLIRTHDLGEYYPDGGFLTHSETDISNEPDAMFASWETLEQGKLAPPADQPKDGKHTELVGTPDWVCEVISDSSVKKDTHDLREAYYLAGISEYWLVDARGEEIDFQILVRQPNGYVAAASKNGWHHSHVFGCQFRLTRKRNRVRNWQYELASTSSADEA